MKKFYAFLIAVSIGVSAFAGASTVIAPPAKPVKLNAADILIPIGKDGQKISLLDLSTMKIKELEKLTGQKMKLADKAGFKVAQKQLSNSINEDGTLNNARLNKYAAKSKAIDSSGFHLGGFALGFLLGLIGVLIAYLIKDDKKSVRTKWAWFGLVAWVVLYLIFFVLL